VSYFNHRCGTKHLRTVNLQVYYEENIEEKWQIFEIRHWLLEAKVAGTIWTCIIGMNSNLTRVLKQVCRKLWQVALFCNKSHGVKRKKGLRNLNGCFFRHLLNSPLTGSLNFAYHMLGGSPFIIVKRVWKHEIRTGEYKSDPLLESSVWTLLHLAWKKSDSIFALHRDSTILNWFRNKQSVEYDIPLVPSARQREKHNTMKVFISFLILKIQ